LKCKAACIKRADIDAKSDIGFQPPSELPLKEGKNRLQIFSCRRALTFNIKDENGKTILDYANEQGQK